MKRLNPLAASLFAIGMTFTAAAAATSSDSGKSTAPEHNLPPKQLTKDNIVPVPDTKMMSQAEQCQWSCYNQSLQCIRAGVDDCNTPYNQCMQYCN